MTDYILNVLSSLIVAIVAAVITSALSLKYFYKQQRWNKKYDTYLETISALHDVKKYCTMVLSDYVGIRPVRSEILKEYGEKDKEASGKIAKAADVGSFVVSREAESILIGLLKQWEDGPDDDYFEYMKNIEESTSNAIKEFTECARRDLKIKIK